MSTLRYTIITIECDEPDCDEAIIGRARMPEPEVLALAEAEGWARSARGFDYCPAHARWASLR